MIINNMKYANIIPLIGGMTLGNIKATNNKPEFIVSFKDVFRDNDNHIVTYLNDVPYYDVSEFTGADGNGCLLRVEDNKFYFSFGSFSTANSGFMMIFRVKMINTSPNIEYLELM